MRKYCAFFMFCALVLGLMGCEKEKPKPKVGVSFGVGVASRWQKEKTFMEERAAQLGMDIEARLNLSDNSRTQTEDCFEMIASGIDVLIYTPRNVRSVDEVVTYAKQHNVKIISYARAAMGQSVDLYVGYDTYKIGKSMGQYLVEKVYRGDIIVLRGDSNDFNATMINYGAMKHIKPLIDKGDFRLVAEVHVPDWSPDAAKNIVRQALLNNGKKIDAIFAPNDKLAGASVEVLQELGITHPVVITGMDAELAAIKRIAAGTQDITVYLDLRDLAYTAVDEAYNLATKKKVNVNSEFDNESTKKINAYLVNGKVVTKENIVKILIEPGYFSREQVYGK